MDVPRLAWRVFSVDAEGALSAPFVDRYWPLADQPDWTAGIVTARCPVDAHNAPHEGCTCGIRGTVKPSELIAAVTSRNLDGASVSVLAATGVLALVELSGRQLPGVDMPHDDPNTTLRAEHARLVELHLAPTLPHPQTIADRHRAAKCFTYTADTWPKIGAGSRLWPQPTPTDVASFLEVVHRVGFGPHDLPDDVAMNLAWSVCTALRAGVPAPDLATELFDTVAKPTLRQAAQFVEAVAAHLTPGVSLTASFSVARQLGFGEVLLRQASLLDRRMRTPQ